MSNCTKCDRLAARVIAEAIFEHIESLGGTAALTAVETFEDGSFILIVGDEALRDVLSGDACEEMTYATLDVLDERVKH